MNTRLRNGLITTAVIVSFVGCRSVVNATNLQQAAKTFTELSCDYKAAGNTDEQSVLLATKELGKDFFQRKVRSENKKAFKDALIRGWAKCNISV
jgi:hypothetical protein